MNNIAIADPNVLIILSAAISLVVSDNLDADELESIGNILTAVADLILLKAGQLAHQENNDNLKKQIADLEDQLCKMKKKCFK